MSEAQPEFTMSELIALCEDEYDAEKWNENGASISRLHEIGQESLLSTC